MAVISMDAFLDFWRKKVKLNPTYIDGVISFMRDLQACDIKVPDKLDKNVTDPYVVALVNTYNEYYNVKGISISDSLSYCRNFKPIPFLNTIENAKEDLVQISKDESVSKFAINSSMNLVYNMPVSMYFPEGDTYFDFGVFKITLLSDCVFVNGISGNTVKNNAIHPYVGTDGYLCLGEFKKSYHSCWMQGLYFECFSIVKQVLTLYGMDSDVGTVTGPHNPLRLWVGVQCAECELYTDGEMCRPCSKTKLNLCEKCAEGQQDHYTKLPTLSQYLSVCETCEQQTVGVKKIKDAPKDGPQTNCSHCRRYSV